MKITKALITAAGPSQRNLALQTLVDKDGIRKSVLEILIVEARQAGIEEIGIIVHPDDVDVYRNLLNDDSQLHFIPQNEARGYGHAILCGADFVGNDYFLHLVGDHLSVNRSNQACAKHLVEIAVQYKCSVSAVISTRESQIPNFGTVGGRRIHGTNDLFQIEKVIEKPTPTLAEQKLIIPGLRAGHYLCFFGMHVLSPEIMKILQQNLDEAEDQKIGLSEALNELSTKVQYLALEKNDLRFDIGSRYGLLKAQLALGLTGVDRDQLMTELLEFFAIQRVN
ncbi:MAG: sugar phosphate nucleotidyltransferase [Paludibacter sp.]